MYYFPLAARLGPPPSSYPENKRQVGPCPTAAKIPIVLWSHGGKYNKWGKWGGISNDPVKKKVSDFEIIIS